MIIRYFFRSKNANVIMLKCAADQQQASTHMAFNSKLY